MSFSCADKDTLIAYVYGEGDEETRRVVETHLATCTPCADEVGGFATVRRTLSEWSPPERAGSFRLVRDDAEPRGATVLRPRRWWQTPLPIWAQAAAAILWFAGGAALANLEVRYGADGVTIRTGWQRPAALTVGPSAQAGVPAGGPVLAGDAPWRADLASLERQMREDFHQQLVAALAAAAPVSMDARSAGAFDENRFMTRVHTLIDESERRQQYEMVYRIGQLASDLQSQRRADLLRVSQGLPQIEIRSGPEQRKLYNYLFPVSQRK